MLNEARAVEGNRLKAEAESPRCVLPPGGHRREHLEEEQRPPAAASSANSSNADCEPIARETVSTLGITFRTACGHIVVFVHVHDLLPLPRPPWKWR